jgi:hypothetical protein
VTVPAGAVIALACALAQESAAGTAGDPGGSATSGAAVTAPVAPWFVEAAAARGLKFLHRNGGGGEKHFPEIMSGGIAVLDYDGDGARDLFFAQGAPFPGAAREGVDHRDRLFRNVSGRFVDVTDAANCSTPGYTFSAIAPDLDGDGDPDLVLCELGGVRLLRNDGGRFTDVTEASGLAERGWPHCAAAADFDRDGDLDLYVGHYVAYDLERALWCGDRALGDAGRSYCHPDEYPPELDRLWENRGDGTFVDVTVAAGLEGALGKCLGLLPVDFDDDGDLDLYVANDSTENFLWRNDGAMRFTDIATDGGCAVSSRGVAQASMGVDAADIELDGDFDWLCTNLALEPNALYRNDGDGFFSERGYESGLGEPSLIWVGFGARFSDVDRDGLEDLLVVNGHVVDTVERTHPGQVFAQPAHLYRNLGGGRFALAPIAEAGEWFATRRVRRALASLDLDDDGDLDFALCGNGEPAELLLQEREAPGGWIGFELEGAGRNRDAIGARVTITAGGRTQRREVRGTCSYNSFVDLRCLFGLADATSVDKVEVRWPRGAITTLVEPLVGRYHRVEEPTEK